MIYTPSPCFFFRRKNTTDRKKKKETIIKRERKSNDMKFMLEIESRALAPIQPNDERMS